MTAQAAAPRLLRAVAETTQPYGPLLEGNALHTLQVLQSLKATRESYVRSKSFSTVLN
jgi:hypothetical protein